MGKQYNVTTNEIVADDLKTFFLKLNVASFFSFLPRVQWKVIHSVLSERRDNLVVMATGKRFYL